MNICEAMCDGSIGFAKSWDTEDCCCATFCVSCVYAKACAKARNDNRHPKAVWVAGWWCCGACGAFPVFPTFTRMTVAEQCKCTSPAGFCKNCIKAAATDICWPCSGGPCYMAAYAKNNGVESTQVNLV